MNQNKTKNEIITELYDDENFNNTLKHFCSGKKRNLLEDLKQEVIIYLFEKTEETIIELYNNKQLKFYYTRLISNQINSTSSPFYYKFRKNELTYEKHVEEFDTFINIEDIDNTNEKILENFDILSYVKEYKVFNWIELEMFITYYKFYPTFINPNFDKKPSYDDIAKVLKVSKTKVWNIMNELRVKLYKSLLVNKITDNEDLKLFVYIHKSLLIKKQNKKKYI